MGAMLTIARSGKLGRGSDPKRVTAARFPPPVPAAGRTSRRTVPCLAGGFDNEAVGESGRALAPEGLVGSADHIFVLEREPVVVQKHAHDGGDALAVQLVRGLQHPYGLSQHDQGNPGPGLHERLGAGHLVWVIPHDQPDQDVRVKRAHAGVADGSESPRPSLRRFSALAVTGRLLGECPATRILSPGVRLLRVPARTTRPSSPASGPACGGFAPGWIPDPER